MHLKTLDPITLGPRRWRQLDSILAANAPGVTQGYANVRKTRGNSAFLAYAVLNDGGQPGERSGDGAFVASIA